MITSYRRNIAKQISISETDQSADIRRTRMEYLSLLEKTFVQYAILSQKLTKQALPFIDWDAVIRTFPSGVGKVVSKRVLIKGRTRMTKIE